MQRFLCVILGDFDAGACFEGLVLSCETLLVLIEMGGWAERVMVCVEDMMAR